MLRSVGKQSGGIRGVSSVEEKKGYGGKDLQKRNVLSLEWKSERVMDDESGESIEPMEQVPLVGLGESELDRLVRGWRREAGSWFLYDTYRVNDRTFKCVHTYIQGGSKSKLLYCDRYFRGWTIALTLNIL